MGARMRMQGTSVEEMMHVGGWAHVSMPHTCLVQMVRMGMLRTWCVEMVWLGGWVHMGMLRTWRVEMVCLGGWVHMGMLRTWCVESVAASGRGWMCVRQNLRRKERDTACWDEEGGPEPCRGAHVTPGLQTHYY